MAVALAALFSLSDSLLTILFFFINIYCKLSYYPIDIFLPSLLDFAELFLSRGQEALLDFAALFLSRGQETLLDLYTGS